MERISRLRAAFLLGIFGLILVLFSAKLFSLQIIETGGNTSNITTYTSLTTVKAARGDILDRNGNVLVGNRASYNLVFNHYVIKGHDDRNQALYDLVKKCDELGLSYADHFPLTETRPFEYTLADYSSAWQGYFQSYLTDRELDSDMTAPLLMEQLREEYNIPAEWTMDEARAVIGLLYEFDLRGVAALANYVFIEDISDENLSEILELNVPGLMVESSTVREYHTTYAAHILGFVGAVSPEQWEYYKTVDGYNMDAVVGQSGFEQAFEEYLHGVDGTRVDVVDTNGNIISQEYREGKEPKAGSNVETTIDINVQMVAEDALADLIREFIAADGDAAGVEGAAVVVMEVKTGDVLACASYPTYDLSTFRENYNEIAEQDFKPFYNRALQGIYPPGSTYKMCTLVAAMENGALAPGETIYTKGQFTKYAPGFAPGCLIWNQSRQIHGTIDATVALQESCNYFFFELADRMDIEELDSTAAALGLGEPTGIELTEKIGWRANKETKKARYTGSEATWNPGDKINAGIGQAQNEFTPLQLCVYTSTLANKGVRYRATFLNRVVSSDYSEMEVENVPEILSTMEMSDETYQTVVDGMIKVSQPDGTGYTSLRGSNVTVAAKTGTAEHGLGSQYSSHASFVCFAPAEEPEIAIAIYAEKGAHGSSLGVVAKEIINSYFSDEAESAVTSSENKLS
ncbi:MAG: hypothetical protein IJZ39_13665 [Oscillospiraceae bacterium]|nr:hypothetical protein [Oscillospiraceae bacterium]MBQ8239179.1 hypothetical protein [Oscillospiraceae bacterium]